MTTKYTFKQEYKPDFNPYGTSVPSTVTMEIDGDVNLTQLLERFEEFLKGSGFHFDGHLDFVFDDCNDTLTGGYDDNMSVTLDFPDGTSETVTTDTKHSSYYYDTDRNK